MRKLATLVGSALGALAVVGLLTFSGRLAQAQTPPADVDNPSAITFTVSADHAALDSYEADILRPDGTTLQIGKPAPDATGTATANINVQPIAFATGYSIRVRAKAGTAVSLYAVSLNKFNRVPGGPSKVTIK